MIDFDPINLPESEPANTRSAADARARRLNSLVAITVALLATFVGICKVKLEAALLNHRPPQMRRPLLSIALTAVPFVARKSNTTAAIKPSTISEK